MWHKSFCNVLQWYCNFPWVLMWKLNCWDNTNSIICQNATYFLCLSPLSLSLWPPMTTVFLCLSVFLSLSLGSSVDPDPSAAADVDPAGPSSDPGCSRAAFSQPAEQHHWGQHLGLCSHTHYPAAPVTAHPDCPCKTQSPMHQCFCSWSWLAYLDT